MHYKRELIRTIILPYDIRKTIVYTVLTTRRIKNDTILYIYSTCSQDKVIGNVDLGSLVRRLEKFKC